MMIIVIITKNNISFNISVTFDRKSNCEYDLQGICLA